MVRLIVKIKSEEDHLVNWIGINHRIGMRVSGGVGEGTMTRGVMIAVVDGDSASGGEGQRRKVWLPLHAAFAFTGGERGASEIGGETENGDGYKIQIQIYDK